MEVIVTFVAGCILGCIVTVLVTRERPVGFLKIVWDREEHQPYMFMQLFNPDITAITERERVTLIVDNEIKFSQK